MDELQLEDLAEYVDAMALVLDLPIPASHRSPVMENFAKLKAIAQMVNEFTLPPEIEAAAVFEP
jgi:Protein of unknown function (DUF4089)